MGAKAQVDVPTGVVTVLLADVEGSVRHWESDAAAMAQAMTGFEALVDEVVTTHGGVRPLEQGEGDSFVAAFTEAGDAVACALALQTALRDGDLRVRMAIHTDDALLRGTRNYAGAVVNRAARLRGLAHGGQVLLSGATRALITDSLCDAEFVDLGSHRLRDVPDPVQVWQLRHPALAADFPPLRSAEALATNLPPQLTTFVGRLDEVRAARKLLWENRLVSLIGPGGIGKTRLALELGADAFDAYPGGVWFADLTPVRDPAETARAIAGALHLADETARSTLEVISTHFSDDRVLLLLDNCEHVVGEVASVVDTLLRACPNLDVVVTSREPLNVGGETTYAVPPLSLPDDGTDITTLADTDAVELFVERVQRVDMTFELTDATARTIAQICRRLDGLPLAIELAAARVRAMPLATIAETLSQRLDVLSGGARTAPLRQQSVAECVAWSHDLLDDPERLLLRRLSVFEGSFALDAVEAVCADDALPSDLVLPTLLALVDKSLVTAADGRYRLLAVIRDFARARLADSHDDAAVLHGRLLRFLVEFARSFETEGAGPGYEQWVTRMRAEEANAEASLRWAEVHDRTNGLALASGLGPYALHSMNLLRGWRWVEPFLDEIETADLKVAADAGFSVALVLLFCGDMALAIEGAGHIHAALDRYERLGDELGSARTRSLLSLIAAQIYPTKEATAQCEASVAELRAAGDEVWATLVLSVLGGRQVQVGRARIAMPYLDDARASAERLGHSFLVTMVDTWRAGAFGMVGDHRTAKAIAERVLFDLRGTPDPDHGSFMNFVIGDAEYHSGNLDEAEYHGRLSAVMGERHNILQHAALGHSLLGRVYMERGRPDEAKHAFERAIAMHDVPAFKARHTSGLAGALMALGEFDEARALLQGGIDAARAGSVSSDLARLLILSASVEAAAGDDDAAENVLHEALAVAVEVGATSLTGNALEHLARIAARQESDVEAARLFGAAAAIRVALGRRAADDAALASARARLGEEAFASALAEGEAMSLEDAAAYASRGRGARKRPSSGWASLTPTETEVVRLVTEGLTNPQIGDRLFIARGTVRTHLTHIFTKLGVTSRAQLAAEATKRGLS